MIDITDKNNLPSREEINAYVNNALFQEMCDWMEKEHSAKLTLQFSRDNALPGWNLRFHKGGRTLCRLYPKKGYFTVLVVIGKREKERAEALLPQMSEAIRAIYQNTREGMGQRWLLIDLTMPDALFRDTKKFIALRKERDE